MLKRNRILLLSSSVVMLCLCLIVGATYALFTESSTVTNHLQAGNLNATLYRQAYAYTVLEKGVLVTKTGGEGAEKDFTTTSANDVNFFGFDKNQSFKIVPGAYVEAAFDIGNTGTTAYDYTISVKPTEGKTSDAAFLSQLYVTIGEYSSIAADGTIIKSGDPIAKGNLSANGTISFTKEGAERLAPGTTKKLYIRVEFVNGENNNNINKLDQEVNAYFDVQVYVVQSMGN